MTVTVGCEGMGFRLEILRIRNIMKNLVREKHWKFR